jgi:thiamine kinase-like enzyme
MTTTTRTAPPRAPDRVLALPCWIGAARAEPVSGGLSNEIWKVTDRAGAHVARFGRDYPFHHVDRAREAIAARAAHAAGFGPAVEYVAPGVMVTAWIAARPWTAADLRANPERIARTLRRFHTEMGAGISGTAVLFWPFHVVRDYGRTLAAAGRADADMARLLRLNSALEAAQVPLPLIFGHNDLLPANILDDDGRLWLIDFEYAGFSTPLFDLAGAASNSGMDEAQAMELLETYFDCTPDPALLRAFDAMRCAALLRETLWARVSEVHLAAPGVDYGAYAAETRDRLAAALDLYEGRYGRVG